jgi:hypothetical protein
MKVTVNNARAQDRDIYFNQIQGYVTEHTQLGPEHSVIYQPNDTVRFVIWKELDRETPEGYQIYVTAQYPTGGCLGCGRKAVWS